MSHFIFKTPSNCVPQTISNGRFDVEMNSSFCKAGNSKYKPRIHHQSSIVLVLFCFTFFFWSECMWRFLKVLHFKKLSGTHVILNIVSVALDCSFRYKRSYNKEHGSHKLMLLLVQIMGSFTTVLCVEHFTDWVRTKTWQNF